MSTTIWRIIKSKHSNTAFDGEGAKLFGGRWNQPGTPMVYTSEHLSLAALELLVHLDSPTPKFSLCKISAYIPKNLKVESLKAKPKSTIEMQAIGSKFCTTCTCAVLKVPSIIIPSEHNFLLNPNHPDFKKIEISTESEFSLDKRLLKK